MFLCGKKIISNLTNSVIDIAREISAQRLEISSRFSFLKNSNVFIYSENEYNGYGILRSTRLGSIIPKTPMTPI